MFKWFKRKKVLNSYYFVIEIPNKITDTFLIKDETKVISERLIKEAIKIYAEKYGYLKEDLKLINIIPLKEE